MSLTLSQLAVCLIALLHVLFMIGELFPWHEPKIMGLVLKKWPRQLELSANDQNLMAEVVHNAGVYNGIVAAGLFTAAWVGPDAYPVQVVLLAGGIVAGIFGAVTLSKATIVQAILGVIAIAVVVHSHSL
jgi:putative membrane protein